VQCDCIVTQLYHDIFRLEYCGVLRPSIHCVVIKGCLSTLCFELSLMWFNRIIETVLRVVYPSALDVFGECRSVAKATW
jgi:hypothetical protein